MGASSSRHRRQRSSRVRSRRSGDWRMLHTLSRLLAVTQQLSHPQGTSSQSLDLRGRRRRQRQQMVQQLAEMHPNFHQLNPRAKGWWLWQGLRWSCPGLLIGWFLAHAATR